MRAPAMASCLAVENGREQPSHRPWLTLSTRPALKAIRTERLNIVPAGTKRYDLVSNTNALPTSDLTKVLRSQRECAR